MKKSLITRILLGVLSLILIFAAISIYLYKRLPVYIDKNSQKVEEILGSPLPEGYYPVLVNFDSAFNKVAYIMAPRDHSMLLFQGPLLKNNKEREQFLNSFQASLQKYSNGSYKQIDTIRPDGYFEYNNKKFPQYKIDIDSENGKTSGMAIFIDTPNNTNLFITMAPSKYFDKNLFLEFIKQLEMQ